MESAPTDEVRWESVPQCSDDLMHINHGKIVVLNKYMLQIHPPPQKKEASEEIYMNFNGF